MVKIKLTGGREVSHHIVPILQDGEWIWVIPYQPRLIVGVEVEGYPAHCEIRDGAVVAVALCGLPAVVIGYYTTSDNARRRYWISRSHVGRYYAVTEYAHTWMYSAASLPELLRQLSGGEYITTSPWEWQIID